MTTKRLLATLILFTLVIGGANLFATYQAVGHSGRAQRHELAVSFRQERHAIAVARRAAEAAARRAIAASNHKWCRVLTLIDRSAAAAKPTTRTGRAFFANFRYLHRQFRC